MAEGEGEDLIPHHGDWRYDGVWSDCMKGCYLFILDDGPFMLAQVWKYGDESHWWVMKDGHHGEELSELQAMVMLGMSLEEVRALGKGRGRPG